MDTTVQFRVAKSQKRIGRKSLLYGIGRADLRDLPLYASRNAWAKILGCGYSTVQRAYESGKLKGEFHTNRVHHTLREILEWRAPGLLREIMEVRNQAPAVRDGYIENDNTKYLEAIE